VYAYATYTIDANAPAAAESVLSVGAIGRADDSSTRHCGQHSSGGLDKFCLAWFSNSGAQICGPGVSVLSAGLVDDLAILSGTSMATPHVAGLVALWVENLSTNIHQKVTAEMLKHRLLGNAIPLECPRALASGSGRAIAPPPFNH
jgi:Subtilase family